MNWVGFENRLTSIVLPGSGGTVSFKYDPFGRRIQKSSPSGTTNYVYDGANVLEEVDGSGNVLTRYVQSPAVDQPLAVVRGSTTSYYEADGLGSITSLSSSSGTLANTYVYDSYGKVTVSSGTVVNPYRYTGREFDPETGLYHYRARYYDVAVGRFVSEDSTWPDEPDLNLYAYVSNSPSNYIDELGYSRDTYVPDSVSHGGPHIDRYNPAGQNVGRYQPDGTPIPHKGKLPPPVPSADKDKFDKAVEKLKVQKCQATTPPWPNVPPGYDCADDACATIRSVWGGPAIPWSGTMPIPADPVVPPFKVPELPPLRIPILEWVF